MNRSLAGLPCHDGVIQLYENYMFDVHAAMQRDDAETLHDLRVTLRHLQVTVANFVQKRAAHAKVLPELKRLICKSNRARDAEVMLTWLQSLWPELDASVRYGAKRWRKELLRCRHRGGRPKLLAAPLEHLMTRLAALPLRSELTGLTMGEAAALRLAGYVAQLQLPQGDVKSTAALHQLRLNVKRLRYLLLPFRADMHTCCVAETRLQLLQEQLGRWHDSVICRQSLTRALNVQASGLPTRFEHAVADGSTPSLAVIAPCFSSMLALARINREREQAALAVVYDNDMQLLRDSLQHAVMALQHTSAV